MQVSRVSYEIRKVLGQYEHENILVEIVQDALESVSGVEMVGEAKAIALSGVTRRDPPRPQVQAEQKRPQSRAPYPASKDAGQQPRNNFKPGRPPGQYTPPDPAKLPVVCDLSKIGEDFEYCKAFIKQHGFKWDKDAKVWRGPAEPQLNSSVSMLQGRFSYESDEGSHGSGEEFDNYPNA